jgi:hypothetical protein
MAFFEVSVTVERTGKALRPKPGQPRKADQSQYWYEIEAEDGEQAERFATESYLDGHRLAGGERITAHSRRQYA